MALIEVHVHEHVDLGQVLDRLADLGRKLEGVDDKLTAIRTQGVIMAGTIQDLTSSIADLKSAVAPLPAAVDRLEAAVTALKSRTTLSPADQAELDAALADVKGIADGVRASVADANDDVDEAATTTPSA